MSYPSCCCCVCFVDNLINVLVVASGKKLEAQSITDGEPLWSVATTGDAIRVSLGLL
jgi:hypothetical protein